jgi:hypothetical protein
MMRRLAALFALLSLGSLLLTGVDQRHLFGVSSEPAISKLPNIWSLNERIRTYGPEEIDGLLLIEAETPCISTGACKIVGVVSPDDGDPTTPRLTEPYLIAPNLEATFVAKLQELSDAYFALADDPERGPKVQATIERLSALGRYPFVVPEPTRVTGAEAEILARGFETQYAPDPAPVPFSVLFLLPALLFALIPIGALRWTRAAESTRRSITLLPGLTVATRAYGLISGVALLVLAVLAIATRDYGFLFGGYALPVATFAALAGATTLFASLREQTRGASR